MSLLLLYGLTVLNGLLAVGLFIARPFHMPVIVSVLSVLFVLVPGWLFFHQSEWEMFYAWRSYVATPALHLHQTDMIMAMALILTTLLCWQMGALLALLKPITQSHPYGLNWTRDVLQALNANQLGFYFGMLILGGLWGLSLVYMWRMEGGAFLEFMTPVKVTGAHRVEGASGYARTIFMLTPLVMMTMVLLRAQRVNFWVVFFIFLAVFVAFSSHQRRELVTVVFYVVGVSIYLLDYLMVHNTPNFNLPAALRGWMSGYRRFVFWMMGIGVLLTVGLWYARLFFTNLLQRGEVMNPLEIRTFWDVLLGSPSTGFPSFLLVWDYVQQFGNQAWHYVFSILSLPIPRALWADKPETIDNILQEHYVMFENPSIMWMSGFYFNVGVLAPVLAFGVGYGLTRLSEHALYSHNLILRVFTAVLFMQVVTFFKNGPLIASIMMAMMAVLLIIGYLPLRYLRF